MEIKIDQEQLQKALIEAVVTSALGGAVADVLKQIVSSSGGYGQPENPIKATLRQAVSRATYKLINEHYSERIEVAVRAELDKLLTEEAVKELAAGIAGRVLKDDSSR